MNFKHFQSDLCSGVTIDNLGWKKKESSTAYKNTLQPKYDKIFV